ncbi:hypothetical protein GTQ40_04715 [Flavobacteriaceae bacterium R38]|nr:hypothetical protein [Flavobacteriaceae bacterium R38]
MLKNILKLNGVTELEKKQQKNIKGGLFGGGSGCPTFCQSAEDCLPDDCPFSFAICSGDGFCLVA